MNSETKTTHKCKHCSKTFKSVKWLEKHLSKCKQLKFQNAFNFFCQSEEWEIITGFENYAVSAFGHVFSIKHDKFLIPQMMNNGYLCVTLRKNNKSHVKLIHRLVAKEFIVNPSPDTFNEINHLNLNKTDNHFTNLEWITRSDNNKHYWNSEKGLKRKKEMKDPRNKTKHPRYGNRFHWMTNGKVNKQIPLSEADKYLDKGFKFGQVRSK